MAKALDRRLTELKFLLAFIDLFFEFRDFFSFSFTFRITCASKPNVDPQNMMVEYMSALYRRK